MSKGKLRTKSHLHLLCVSKFSAALWKGWEDKNDSAGTQCWGTQKLLPRSNQQKVFFLFPPEAGLIEIFHWKPEVIDSFEHFLSAKNRDNTCHKSCYNKELLCSIIVNAAAVFPVVTVCQNVTDIRTFCLCVGVCVYLMPDTISFPSARRKLRRDQTNHCVADFPLISTGSLKAPIKTPRQSHCCAMNINLPSTSLYMQKSLKCMCTALQEAPNLLQ